MNISPEKITAVVLAGGFGKRIRHLLPDIPKPMAPVNGRPFLEWVVRYLAAQKVRRVILSTGHLAETVAKHFQAQPVAGVKVTCVPETRPLGTAGGFLNAFKSVAPSPRPSPPMGERVSGRTGEGEASAPEAFLVLNGDSLAPAPLAQMFQSLDEPKVEGAILGVHVADASRFGTILQNAVGDLAGFSEKKPGAGIINAGIYLFRAAAIELFQDKTPLSFEADIFPALIARGARLKVCVTDVPFLDIGTPESLPLAEAFIRQHAQFFES